MFLDRLCSLSLSLSLLFYLSQLWRVYASDLIAFFLSDDRRQRLYTVFLQEPIQRGLFPSIGDGLLTW